MDVDTPAGGLVYGLVGPTLVVVGEVHAVALADEIARWKAITSNVDALRLAQVGDGYLPPPVQDYVLEERIEESLAEDPGDPSGGEFSLRDCDAVNEGTWPGISQDVPEEWDLVEETAEGMAGDGYAAIYPDREQDLLELAARDGLPIRRDDDLLWAITLGAGE